MNGGGSDYETAEALRKTRKYAEAAPIFAVLWGRNPSVYVGWRYAQCLRKVGNLEEADRVVRSAAREFPGDRLTKKELGWVLYDKELKPAVAERDLARATSVADQILVLNPEIFALRLVALAMMRLAKSRENWEAVLEWAGRVEAGDLSTEPRVVEGKRTMSERETWYVSKARALLELKNFNEARILAQRGLHEFPGEFFLARTAALALARSGDVQGGAQELRELLMHPRADWYVKAELGELEYQLGNHPEAYRLMCEALSKPQNDKYKLGYIAVLARIALSLGRHSVAAEHVAFARALRAANEWSIPDDLVQLEREVQSELRVRGLVWPEMPKDVQGLSRLCRNRWNEGAVIGVKVIQGGLGRVDPNKPYAFIKPSHGGADVYVLVGDIPSECRREGAMLEFTIRKSFDRKKKRESTQAINVRCV